MYMYTTAAGGSVLVVWIEPHIRSVSLSIHMLTRGKVGLLMHDILQTYWTKFLLQICFTNFHTGRCY